uniref:Uncharacterized protein n=1 Tax=Arsenophonus nasoniae TaxID=638 RepID=D2TYX2_9GAMM|nr:hypothetical protein ARN_13560 [Arsenophonus nasoniae]
MRGLYNILNLIFKYKNNAPFLDNNLIKGRFTRWILFSIHLIIPFGAHHCGENARCANQAEN